MNQAKVFIHDRLAGLLTEDENGYHFMYDESYLKCSDSEPISVTFPLSNDQYNSNVLFPFFDGLIPEGWLLDIAQKN